MKKKVEVYKMKLTIIYDNEVYKKDAGLKSDWGFAAKCGENSKFTSCVGTPYYVGT